MARGSAVVIGVNELDEKHYDGYNIKLNSYENDAKAMEEMLISAKFYVKTFITEQRTKKSKFNIL